MEKTERISKASEKISKLTIEFDSSKEDVIRLTHNLHSKDGEIKDLEVSFPSCMLFA